MAIHATAAAGSLNQSKHQGSPKMSTVREETKAVFKKAVERARWAPSVHNTQPWHFVVRPDVLELHVANNRKLRALDPTGRQMVISCGCV
jgi:Putative TM nitroreductase